MIPSDLNDLGDGSRQPFFLALKFAKFAVDFNQRSNLCLTKTHPQGIGAHFQEAQGSRSSCVFSMLRDRTPCSYSAEPIMVLDTRRRVGAKCARLRRRMPSL